MPAATVDTITKKWIKCRADEIAVERHGCVFDEARGEHVCNFINNHLKLYEGLWAGNSFKLMQWQEDLLYRIFGWVKFNKHSGKNLRRFKRSFIWISKKNGKSPMAAGIALYLFLSDRTKGNEDEEKKVFIAARDGKQARVVFRHAAEMVKMTKVIEARCRVNDNLGTISDSVTPSRLQIVSGDNFRSQEGLNGSVIIDEVHVVSRKLADVLKYMGISRPESLQFCVSTAGNDKDSWGYEQFEYGESVQHGEIDDPTFFHHYDGVPQMWDDNKCLTEEAYKRANPSYGIIIDPEEIDNEAKASNKAGAITWQNFKMYRLNQWQQSSAPWLKESNWSACTDKGLDLEHYFGKQVAIGLDLSSKRDICALAMFTIDEDTGKHVLFTWFWMLESYAIANAQSADFIGWAQRGDIELVSGQTIDYGYIQKRIKWIKENYDVKAVAYDKYKITQLKQWWEDELEWYEDQIAFAFPQTITHFATPTGEFERLVIAEELAHNGNEVMNWMVRHCDIKEDANNNKRPVKPPSKGVKKIDGVVAAIQALWAVDNIEDNGAGKYYEDNEVELWG